MISPDGKRVPWYRPGWADGVFLVLALLIFRAGQTNMLDDPGLGWHLRAIDAILEHGGWLEIDPFTYPHEGKPKAWKTNQWLGEAPLWIGWKLAGEEGIVAVTSLVLAFALRCLFSMLMRDGVPMVLAILWTVAAGIGSSPSWVARPNIFTMLFLLLTVRVCDLFHQGRCSRKFTFWLVPLFAVWANCHGGFVAGLMTLGATLAVETGMAIGSLSSDQRQAARQRAMFLVFLTVACFAATLVNPYGLFLYPWVFQLLGNDFFMNLNQEWHSPDFHGKGAMRFELLMLLYPVVLGLSRRRPNLVELALGIAWLHFALNGFRYVALWVLVVIPSMARSAMQIPWLEGLAEKLKLNTSDMPLFQARTGPVGWGASLLVPLVLLGASFAMQGKGVRHNPEFIPAKALAKVLEMHRERPNARIFHAIDWGGYLTWQGWPTFLNWIDDRNEVQGEAWIRDWDSIVTAEPGWRHKLDDALVELIALQPTSPLVKVLLGPEAEKTWEVAYRDPYAIIFKRRTK